MTVAEFDRRYPGLTAERFTLTDVEHAIRANSHGNLGDTFWGEVCVALAALNASDTYPAGVIFEALSGLLSADWMRFSEHHLISDLQSSQRAGGIRWEIVPVGGQQLMWRPVADEAALAALTTAASTHATSGRVNVGSSPSAGPELICPA